MNSVSKSRQSYLQGSPNCFDPCSNTDPYLQELLVIASLTVSVGDILRFILTRSKNGLPLSMITMDKRFAEIKFFFSRRFWYGIWKLPRGRRWFVLLWLSASGIIATLVGPATAVLLIPQLRYDWPAGAANYSIVGNESTIFPRTITLENDSGGGSLCDLPSTATVEMPPSTHLGCPWAGYSALLAVYTQWGSDLIFAPIHPIPLYEWQQPREILQHIRGRDLSPESWATGTRPAINVWSGSLDIAWLDAVKHVKFPSPAVNFKRGSGRKTYQPTSLPAVRTICHHQNQPENSSLSVSIFTQPILI